MASNTLCSTQRLSQPPVNYEQFSNRLFSEKKSFCKKGKEERKWWRNLSLGTICWRLRGFAAPRDGGNLRLTRINDGVALRPAQALPSMGFSIAVPWPRNRTGRPEPTWSNNRERTGQIRGERHFYDNAVFGPCNRGLQYLLGADFALGDEPGERDGVVLAIFLEPHGLQIPGLKPVENEYSCSHLATSYFIISVILA
jgi:hypothetical protein